MSISDLLILYFWLFLGFMLWCVIAATVETVRHGHYSDFTLAPPWLGDLLRRGYAGGYLTLVHEPTGRFIHFRKYIRGKGDYGLELRVRNLDWLMSILQRARSVVESAGLPHRVEHSKTEDGFRDVLIVDCGRDTAAAYDLGRSICTGVFEISLQTPFKVYSDGLSTTGELIDGPDQPPPIDDFPSEERLKELDRRLRKSGGLSVRSGCIWGLSVLVWLVSGLGFPISMI